MSRKPARRGRPPLDWIDTTQMLALPAGTAVTVETRGRRTTRLVGRITAVTDHTLTIATPTGGVELHESRIVRGRVVASVYEPGDAVLKRHVPADVWRGGVVRTEGTDVLVEQIETAPDGTATTGFGWIPEDALEPAEARDPVLPQLPRGPVPARSAG